MRLKLQDKRKAVILFGHTISTALSIVFFAAFLHAYFSNDFTFYIDINVIGEAYVELVIFAILIPLLCYGMYLQYKETKKYEKRINKEM